MNSFYENILYIIFIIVIDNIDLVENQEVNPMRVSRNSCNNFSFVGDEIDSSEVKKENELEKTSEKRFGQIWEESSRAKRAGIAAGMIFMTVPVGVYHLTKWVFKQVVLPVAKAIKKAVEAPCQVNILTYHLILALVEQVHVVR